MLVLHSPTDDLVDIDHARRIYEAARHPKSFVSIDGADHLLTDRTDAEYAARPLSAWSSRCLPADLEGGSAVAGVSLRANRGTGPRKAEEATWSTKMKARLAEPRTG